MYAHLTTTPRGVVTVDFETNMNELDSSGSKAGDSNVF